MSLPDIIEGDLLFPIRTKLPFVGAARRFRHPAVFRPDGDQGFPRLEIDMEIPAGEVVSGRRQPAPRTPARAGGVLVEDDGILLEVTFRINLPAGEILRHAPVPILKDPLPRILESVPEVHPLADTFHDRRRLASDDRDGNIIGIRQPDEPDLAGAVPALLLADAPCHRTLQDERLFRCRVIRVPIKILHEVPDRTNTVRVDLIRIRFKGLLHEVTSGHLPLHRDEPLVLRVGPKPRGVEERDEVFHPFRAKYM